VQNQQLASRPQVALQESVQPVTKVQYPCGCDTVFTFFTNVKMSEKINVDAGGAASNWHLAISQTLTADLRG
jgi:hypothetical protein